MQNHRDHLHIQTQIVDSKYFNKKLAIIAGKGSLPGTLKFAWESSGGSVFILAFNNITPPSITEGVSHKWVGLGKISSAIKALHYSKCEYLVLAGSISKPNFLSLSADLRGALLIKRLLTEKGDDAILKIIISELEQEGFQIIGVKDIVKDLTTPTGLLTENGPSKTDWIDINIAGLESIRLGDKDIGQAAISRTGKIIGTEDDRGTDSLILRCASIGKEPSGVLVKRLKPNQDIRVDLPTIGPKTVENVVRSGLKGIALESLTTLILERDEVIKMANKSGLFIYGVSQNEWTQES